MKKMIRFISIFLMSIILFGATTPLIQNTVYASKINTLNKNGSKTMNTPEIEILVHELKLAYPSLPEEYLREGVYKQLRGDYSISKLNNTSFRSIGWQGITVEQFGAFIDTALGILIGGGLGAISTVLKNMGKQAARDTMKKAIIRAGLSSIPITNTILDFATNFYSPGQYIAKKIDSVDPHPNNGRINFSFKRNGMFDNYGL